MMKYKNVYAIILVFVFCTFCKNQNKADLPKVSTKSEFSNAITSASKQSAASFFFCFRTWKRQLVVQRG